ncbi:hypothetical protein D3C80_1263950 [compost metagenome]
MLFARDFLNFVVAHPMIEAGKGLNRLQDGFTRQSAVDGSVIKLGEAGLVIEGYALAQRPTM